MMVYSAELPLPPAVFSSYPAALHHCSHLELQGSWGQPLALRGSGCQSSLRLGLSLSHHLVYAVHAWHVGWRLIAATVSETEQRPFRMSADAAAAVAAAAVALTQDTAIAELLSDCVCMPWCQHQVTFKHERQSD